MRDEVFLKMNTDYVRLPAETDQEYMERVITAALDYDWSLDTFNEKVPVKLISCDAKAMSACLSFEPEDWMRNQDGILHGGISCSLFDVGIGLLAKYYMEKKAGIVTVQMNVEFIRPVPMDIPIVVNSYCVKTGRRVFFGRAEIVDGRDGSVLCSASAVYM